MEFLFFPPILYNADNWPMWKIYLVHCNSALNKFYCIKIDLSQTEYRDVNRFNVNMNQDIGINEGYSLTLPGITFSKSIY
jgi:hypothetical protein